MIMEVSSQEHGSSLHPLVVSAYAGVIVLARTSHSEIVAEVGEADRSVDGPRE